MSQQLSDVQQVSEAEIVREFGPYAGADQVHGVSFDGERAWIATGRRLLAIDLASGQCQRVLERACDAGTAFDGTSLYQLADGRIDKFDPVSGALIASIPAPGRGGDSGLAWAEGSLWVGQYRERLIHRIDPDSGAILHTLRSDRFVTGVSWVDGELWHGTWEGEASDIRRIDPSTGEVHERLAMPPGTAVSGLEADGRGQFLCGGGPSGTLRVVRRSRRTL